MFKVPKHKSAGPKITRVKKKRFFNDLFIIYD